MQRISMLSLVLILTILFLGTSTQYVSGVANVQRRSSEVRTQYLDSSLLIRRDGTNSWSFVNERTEVAGSNCKYYGRMFCSNPRFASFDVEGWDKFVTTIGTDDTKKVDVKITVDGEVVKNLTIYNGTPERVEIDLPQASVLRIDTRGGLGELIFCEPTLIKY